MINRRRIIFIFLPLVLACLGFSMLCSHCPESGIAISRKSRNFHRLKNRTVLPKPADFDYSFTLERVLEHGDDTARWSPSRAGKLEGYVVAIGSAGVELANCYVPCSRDLHINLALRPDAPAREQVVVEITPPMRNLSSQQGFDWSETALRRELLGRWVQFEGWLLFDWTHSDEAENTAPGVATNWRATGWEIHPVTSFRVIR